MSKVYKAKRIGTKVVTGKVRLSYAHLHEPYAIEGNDPRYSVSLIIPKSDKETIFQFLIGRIKTIMNE